MVTKIQQRKQWLNFDNFLKFLIHFWSKLIFWQFWKLDYLKIYAANHFKTKSNLLMLKLKIPFLFAPFHEVFSEILIFKDKCSRGSIILLLKVITIDVIVLLKCQKVAFLFFVAHKVLVKLTLEYWNLRHLLEVKRS